MQFCLAKIYFQYIVNTVYGVNSTVNVNIFFKLNIFLNLQMPKYIAVQGETINK